MKRAPLKLGENEAECYRQYGCFVLFSKRPGFLPIARSYTPRFRDEELEVARVVAIQEVHMRVQDGGVEHGYLYILVSELKVPAAGGGLEMILREEMVQCYHAYGYVAMPFGQEDELGVGRGTVFLNAGYSLRPGQIVAVQRFRPSWPYLFIVAAL